MEVVGDEESAVSGVEWIGEGKFIGGAGGWGNIGWCGKIWLSCIGGSRFVKVEVVKWGIKMWFVEASVLWRHFMYNANEECYGHSLSHSFIGWNQ